MANPNIKRAVRVALIAASAGGAALYGAASVAQEAELEQVIVTGSRIPQPNLEGTSPVSLISNADIKVQGTQQVEDLINNMPQVFAGQGGNYSNGASGTATVNLRGLGSSRTKVLINGRSMVAGSPRGPEAPDLNQIPAPLIERVEVLTGGASAVYGSDAVAGVVNFIMKDNFEGVQFDGNYSFYNHKNSDDRMQDFVAAPNYKQAPNSICSDGDSYELSMLMGSNFADDKGNATFFVGYRETDPLLQSERDYSACSLNASNTGCGGSGTSFPGNVGNFNFSSQRGIDPTTGNPASTTNVYNFGPVNYWQRPDERWTASAFIHYDVTDNAQVYSEFMFHDDRTKSQIAPSGAFGVGVAVDCNGGNPLLSQGWLDFLCANPNGVDADGMTTAYVLRRNVEGGGRQDDIRHTSYRGVIGVKGDVFENWNYDVSASYSTVVFSETYLNDFSNTRVARALDVVADADGNPVCRSVLNGIDPSCVPYNIWQAGGVTPEALAYLQIPLFSKGDTELRTVTATMASDLGAYGLKFPTANDGIGDAFGAEYREQYLDFQTDPNFASGDGAGQGGPTIGQSGGYNNMDLFAEVRVPILQGMTMADSLMLTASYRYSDYSNPINEKTNTYGVGLEWAPIKDFKLRGSYQRAVRAPSIIELFAAQGVGLYDNDADPCAGDLVVTDVDPADGKDDIPPPSATAAQCANTGVTADQYGHIADNPAAQYNALFGGNTNLDPETSDSYTVGFVFQPGFAPGLSITVDYFDIKVEDVISTISPTITLQQCLETGSLCDLIHRDAGGTLWLTSDAYIEATNLNIGKLQTSGFDLDVRYMTDIGSMGTLGFSLVGTYLDELTTEPIAGAGSIGEYDCAGLYGSTCGTPNPEWRHSARVTWGTPWNVDLTLGWRYFDEVTIDRADKNPLLTSTRINPADRKLDAQNYIDIAASWTFMESYEVRLGVNNVMDDDPPISSVVGAGAGNGNTYPQVYDALGRYVFMGFTAKF
jgi:outer membrane receptor protein involved in Fe transport